MAGVFAGEAGILAATMDDRMTLCRQQVRAGGLETVTVYQDRACALSRSAHTANPAPMGPGALAAESHYRMSLFMPAGTVTRLGDRVEIRRGGQVFRGSASDSVSYPSHSVCVVDIREVGQND